MSPTQSHRRFPRGVWTRNARWPMPNFGSRVDRIEVLFFFLDRVLVRRSQLIERRPLLAVGPTYCAVLADRAMLRRLA